jgi:chemosensory pili system protein ChpC
MADALDSLNGLIVPMAEQPLLLPNVAVAELVGFRLSQPAEKAPEWFLGWASWRDQKVPLVDPERLLGQLPTTNATAPARTLILNALGGRPGMPFIGLRVWGIPRSRKVVRGEIEQAGEGRRFVSQSVRLAGSDDVLLIPDLHAFEDALADLAANAARV